MFNIGGGELIVIMLIALIVLGPQRLPDAARQVGKTMGDLRRLSSGFQNEMKNALDTAEDPARVASRRNVLAKDDPAPTSETATPARKEPLVADAIAAVSAQPSAARPSAPAKKRPPAAQAMSATKKAAARKAPLKAAPAQNGTPVKGAAKPKATAGASKKQKKAAATVSKASPRRTKS